MLSYLQALHQAPGAAKPSPEAVSIGHADRRAFLKGAAATAIGLAIAARFSSAFGFESYPTGGSDMPHGLVNDPHVFVSIDPDGTVTIVAHRSEMGTGIRTSLPLVIADEMEADWSRVKIVQAQGDEPRYGNQDTDGSRSMRHHIQPCRQIGATVRAMLRQAAAEQWGVDIAKVAAVNHEVIDESSGRRLGYGDLAEKAMALPVPAAVMADGSPNPALQYKDEEEFRYIGKGEIPIFDLRDITTGRAIYGADVRLPGMKYAVISRPPVVGGKVISYDDSAALQIKGVERTLQLEGSMPPAKFAPLGGVAVIASHTDAAIKGRNALEIEWDDGPHAAYDSAAYRAEMEATAEQPGKVLRDQGDVESAFKSAARTFKAVYHQAHMAHAPMEPPVAVAHVADGKVEIWAPVQSPFGVRQDVADTLGVSIEDVTVNVTLLGGGFGRKSKCDYVLEAALLSKELGAPVKVQWTREDDIRHGFFHTTSIERIEVVLDREDKVVGWLHRSVAPSIVSTFAPDEGHQFAIENGMGHVDMPFEIGHVRCETGKALAHTRIGWFRSVSNIPHGFAVQSFAAELAHELGKDQKAHLLELIGSPRIIDPAAAGMPADFWNYGEVYEEYPIDTGRLAHVLNVAADAAGWGKTLPKGEGLGLAVHRSFVTYVAAAVHVKIVDGEIRIPEVHLAIDCGFAANPERIRSQMEGAAVMGMTAALKSGITFENGRAVQSNFHDYDVVRTLNYPERVHTHIVDHPFKVHASGVGEPGLPPIAPAIANAIFNATGKRLRSLPIGDRIDI